MGEFFFCLMPNAFLLIACCLLLKKAGVSKTASYPHPKKIGISFNLACDDILHLFCAEALL